MGTNQSNNLFVELMSALSAADFAWQEFIHAQQPYTDNAIELARLFVLIRQAKERAETVTKDIAAVYEGIQKERLPEVFEAAGTPTVTLDEGFRVTVSHKVYASIKKDNREQAYQWLRDNDLGDLITNTVNASTLAAVAKTLAEENRELDPDLFTVAVVPNTSVTKTKNA